MQPGVAESVTFDLMPRLAGDAPRMLWQTDLRDRTRSTVTRYEPVVANDVVLLPIQYRSGGMNPCSTTATGNGPAPSGSEMVPVIVCPPLGQVMWYLVKPALRNMTSPIASRPPG